MTSHDHPTAPAYRIVNDRYANSSDPISGWAEFVEMCQSAFGDEFAEPRHHEDENGVIWALEKCG